MKSNNLEGSLPWQISKLKYLTYLDLSKNHFDGHLPSELKELNKIWYIDLSNNNFSGELPLDVIKLVSENNLPLQQITNGNKIIMNIS